MTRLYINLLNFNSTKLAGAGYFFKRIAGGLDFDDPKWNGFNKIIILSNDKVDVVKIFGLKDSKKIEVKQLKYAHNFLVRIFYEQLYLPLILKKGVFFSPTPAVPLLSKVFNSRLNLIPTIHDMIPFKIANKYNLLRSFYVKFISFYSAKVATQVVTVSNYSKADIVEITNIHPAKVSVVYNFIPELRPMNSLVDENYFLTVCTIEPGKNIEVMLQGFKLFLERYPQYSTHRYVLVGQFGWQYHAILKLVEKLGLKEKVTFTGYVSDLEKNELIARCTGMIYLSRYEGFGIPPLEAMYFNKLSIVSDNSSLPEVVGEAGIVQGVLDIDKLADNMKRIIEEKGAYLSQIPAQLYKFNPLTQVATFEKVLLQQVD